MAFETPNPPMPDLAGIAFESQRINPILKLIIQDVLARAQDNGLSRTLFPVGKYLLRRPDYRQILRLAKSLGMTRDACLAELAACRLELLWHGFQPFWFGD